MDWRRSDDSAERFSAYLQEIAGVMEHAARVEPMRAYCSGLLLECERKSVEPIAAATAPNATSAQHQSLLHFPRQGRVVRREGARQGARAGAAADRAARVDRGLDQRRHELPQMRVALGRRLAPILRPAWQAGQLPSRRLAVGGQSCGEPSHRLSALSSRKLGERREAPQEGRRSRQYRISNQAENRAAADRMGVRGRHCARRGADGLRLWVGLVVAPPPHGARSRLRGGGMGENAGAQGQAGRRRAGDGDRSRQEPAEAGLAHDRLAQRHQCAARLALRARARVRRRRGHDRRGARGVADPRVAERREGAHEILAVHACRGHRFRAHDRYHHDALAHRARLSGAEVGNTILHPS